MTSLFNRIKPAERFRITKRLIAKFLGIAESLIKEVDNWPYVIYVHRSDRGGQFISYRKIEKWKNAVASQIQKCSTLSELQQLSSAIRRDYRKHRKQYEDFVLQFFQKIWDNRRDYILKQLASESILEGIFVNSQYLHVF